MGDNETAFDIVRGIVLLILLAFLAIRLFGFMRAITEENARKSVTVTTETVQLVSLDYASEVEGTIRGFNLGLTGSIKGTVSETGYYVAYQILEDGGKSLYKIPVDIAILYDVLETGEAAYAEVDKNGYGEKKQIRVYVPIGTVPQEYNVAID